MRLVKSVFRVRRDTWFEGVNVGPSPAALSITKMKAVGDSCGIAVWVASLWTEELIEKGLFLDWKVLFAR